MNRIFKLFALASLGAYVAARLLRRTSAPTHTKQLEAPIQFRVAVDPDTIRAAHAEPVRLRE